MLNEICGFKCSYSLKSPKSALQASFYLTNWGKRRANQSKISKRKEIMKIKTENNDTENTEIIKKKLSETIASLF